MANHKNPIDWTIVIWFGESVYHTNITMKSCTHHHCVELDQSGSLECHIDLDQDSVRV